MRIARRWAWLAGLTIAVAGTAWAQVDTIASVKQKGKIVVGVKADYSHSVIPIRQERSSGSRSILPTTSRNGSASGSSWSL